MKSQDIINNYFIELLERGVAPWRQPWQSRKRGLAQNIISGNEYTGCNFFITNFQDYKSAKWGTYKQFKSLGGQVRKGEKGTPILFYKAWEKEDEFGKKEIIPVARAYFVFNLDQVDGIEIEEGQDVELAEHDIIESCESLISNFPLGFPKAVHVHDRAFYRPIDDVINLPEMGLFGRAEEYYHTYFHEAVHATGHERRLKRAGVTPSNYFGDDCYSKEELIAELGASYLSAHAKIDNHIIENSASYLAGWLKVLRQNPRFITQASAKAWQAYEYLTKS